MRKPRADLERQLASCRRPYYIVPDGEVGRQAVAWPEKRSSKQAWSRSGKSFTLTAATEFGFDGGGFLSDPRI